MIITRKILKLFLFSLLVIISILIGVFTIRINQKLHKKIIFLFYVAVLKIFNVKIDVSGAIPNLNLPNFFVSNHISYFDVIILGYLVNPRFTPKQEVAKWPVIGFLAGLSRPVYVDRNPRKTLENKNNIEAALNSGDSIFVFPEATTSNGKEILPFKSSFFSAVNLNTAICPVAIIYNDHKNIAWFGDMEFFSHFWNLLGTKKIKVKVIFNDIIHLEDFPDRKALSKYCQDLISKNFENEKEISF